MPTLLLALTNEQKETLKFARITQTNASYIKERSVQKMKIKKKKNK